MSPSPSAPEGPWFRIWQSDSGIWNVLTEATLKQFPLEQLAIHWANGRAVEA